MYYCACVVLGTCGFHYGCYWCVKKCRASVDLVLNEECSMRINVSNPSAHFTRYEVSVFQCAYKNAPKSFCVLGKRWGMCAAHELHLREGQLQVIWWWSNSAEVKACVRVRVCARDREGERDYYFYFCILYFLLLVPVSAIRTLAGCRAPCSSQDNEREVEKCGPDSAGEGEQWVLWAGQTAAVALSHHISAR